MNTAPELVLPADDGTAGLSIGRPSFAGRLFATPKGRIGGLIIAAIVAAAVCAPLIARYNPLQPDLSSAGILLGVSGHHILGTDDLGRDVFSRILYGSRISLFIAGAAVALAVVLGTALGTIAASAGEWWDVGIMRLMDALLAFPVLVLAIALSLAVGRGVLGLIVAVTVVNIPVFTRLTRAQALHINTQQYITAATAIGAGAFHTIRHHVIPNLVNTLIVQATVALSFAIIIEAGLSFLGLGVQAPDPDWGVMISTAETFMITAPHMMLAPAGAIFITVLGLNLLGDALSDVLDPRASRG